MSHSSLSKPDGSATRDCKDAMSMVKTAERERDFPMTHIEKIQATVEKLERRLDQEQKSRLNLAEQLAQAQAISKVWSTDSQDRR